MPRSASAGNTSGRPLDTLDTALEMGFQQCVELFRKTLLAAPLGWLFVSWLVGNDVPPRALAQWIALFAALWVPALAILIHLSRRHITIARDGWLLYLAAALDGLAWGSSLPLLAMEGHVYLWLIVVVCNITSLVAPTFMSHIRAYRFHSMALYLMVLVNCLRHYGDPTIGPIKLLGGMALFIVFIHLYMSRASKHIMQGLRLRIENTALTERLRESLRTAKHDATTDPLTGLANRRMLDDNLALWQNRVDHSERDLSVLMVDLDYFKQINDAHGHEVGDRVLQTFAEHVRSLLRTQDLFARHGGEEFVILLPDSTIAIARHIANRIHASLQDAPLIDHPPVSVTASIGIAQHHGGESVETMMARADAAAYAAKHLGRNRVQEAD